MFGTPACSFDVEIIKSQTRKKTAMSKSVNVGNATLSVTSKIIKGEHVTIIPGEFIDEAGNRLATANVIINEDGTSIRLNPASRGDVTVLFQYAKDQNTATVYICNDKNNLEDIVFEHTATTIVESVAGTVLGAFDVAYTPQLVDFARALVESATGLWDMLTSDMLIEALGQK